MLNYIKISLLPCAVALLFTGCDSGLSTDTNDTINIQLANRGIDLETAAANPNATADLPEFFLSTDTIVHSNVNINRFDDRGNSLLTTSAANSELDNANLNNGGELILNNVDYSWKRSQNPHVGSFILGQEHQLTGSDQTIYNYILAQMDLVIAASSGNSSGLASTLNNSALNSSFSSIVTEAASSIGFQTEIGPEFSVHPGVLQGYVLIDRAIDYTVTSTNSQLTQSNTISGTYSYIDTWALLDRITLTTDTSVSDDFNRVGVRFSENPFTIIRVADFENGNFTITINN